MDSIVPPPLWTPHDERVFRRAALASQPSAIDGWSLQSRIVHFFFGSVRATIARFGMLVGLVFFVAALPELADDSSWGNLWRVAGYHGWTLVILVLVSTRIRALPAHRLATFVILGASAAALAVFYLSGPITDLTNSDTPSVWVTPPLEEAVKLLIVAAVLFGARRRLIQPGVFDFAILGYAVGAGFAFHEDALWGRVTTSGFESPWGYLFPSFFQPAGFLVVGHAAWTAIAAIGLGLIVLHWRRPLRAVAGAVMIIVPVVDHMAINSRNNSFDWVVDVLFDHKLSIWLLAGGLALAFVVDLGVLRSAASRDHLLPTQRRPSPSPGQRPGQIFALRRYRRTRNSIHFARHRDRAIWPASRSAATAPSLVALGREAHAAGHAVGPRADRGWDLDPVDPGRARWFTDEGWSPYVVSSTGVAIDAAPGRPGVVGTARDDPPANWITMIALFSSVVAAAVAIRLLTVPEDVPGGFQFGSPSMGRPDTSGPAASSLAGAPNGPPGAMFGPALGGSGGLGGPGPGDGPGGPGDGPDGPDGDPPPLPPDFFDGIGGPGGPSDAPPDETTDDEDDCP